MKPALSLVFFTVLSGAGFGLAVFIAFTQLPPRTAMLTVGVSLTLVAAGLGASALHLANPKNAWRAVMRARTSWLSREALLAAGFFPLLLLALLLRSPVLYTAAAVCALGTVYCTAMIYQSLKPIPQWHHPSTAINYLALSLMSGGVLYHLLGGAGNGNTITLTLVATFIAGAGKVYHYHRIGACADITVGAATNFSRAQARLLDAGHTGENFLTQEFIYRCPAATLRLRRHGALALTFLSPPLALLQPLPFALLPAALMFAGLLLERWLFFAEARHSIRAYYT